MTDVSVSQPDRNSRPPRQLGDILVDLLDAVQQGSWGRAEVVRSGEREPISDATRHAVKRRDHFRCVWCGSTYRLQLDHIVPWSAGGSDDPSNLRVLCERCNTDRSNYITGFDLPSLPIVDRCLRCDGGDELDDACDVYCSRCNRRSRR